MGIFRRMGIVIEGEGEKVAKGGKWKEVVGRRRGGLCAWEGGGGAIRFLGGSRAMETDLILSFKATTSINGSFQMVSQDQWWRIDVAL